MHVRRRVKCRMQMSSPVETWLQVHNGKCENYFNAWKCYIWKILGQTWPIYVYRNIQQQKWREWEKSNSEMYTIKTHAAPGIPILSTINNECPLATSWRIIMHPLQTFILTCDIRDPWACQRLRSITSALHDSIIVLGWRRCLPRSCLSSCEIEQGAVN